MIVSLRKFTKDDIPKKVEWINNPDIIGFFIMIYHLKKKKHICGLKNIQGRTDRYDAVIEADGIPCGTIGLLSIDTKNSKAEYYIAMGEVTLKGKGVSTQASKLILEYAFEVLGLNRVYLFTETENIPAQRLFEKVGFVKEGCIRSDIFSHGKFVDRYVYGITRTDFFEGRMNMWNTPIQQIEEQIYIKRDDMIPYSFGGNKARKGFLFFEEIEKGKYDCVVTYGSSHSNHCRIIANMAAARKMPCYIIGPQEVSDLTYNSRFMKNVWGRDYYGTS